MLFGHLAVSGLEHRYLKAEFIPVMVAGLFPDAVDKVAHYILGQGEGGRLLGHTLVAALVTTLIVWAIGGRTRAVSWALGYLSHLVCDAGHMVPWLSPFISYTFPPSEGFWVTLWASLTNIPRMLLEVGLSIWAVVALWPKITPWVTSITRRGHVASSRDFQIALFLPPSAHDKPGGHYNDKIQGGGQ